MDNIMDVLVLIGVVTVVVGFYLLIDAVITADKNSNREKRKMNKNPNDKLTTDPTDPDLTRGVDTKPVEQAKKYLVLSEEERTNGWVRPFRDAYTHEKCGVVTSMGRALSETYAKDPKFYGATYCIHCRMHLPVGEFKWLDGEVVGS